MVSTQQLGFCLLLLASLIWPLSGCDGLKLFVAEIYRLLNDKGLQLMGFGFAGDHKSIEIVCSKAVAVDHISPPQQRTKDQTTQNSSTYLVTHTKVMEEKRACLELRKV